MKQRQPTAGERCEAIQILYEAKWADGAIARVLGTSPATVGRWRAQQNLPPHGSVFAEKIDNKVALEMYHAGASDGEIARRFGATQSGATRWRHRRGLPANMEPNPVLDRGDIRRAKAMLRLGATKRQVADELGRRHTTCVRRLRSRMSDTGLRQTGITNRTIRAQVLGDKSIMPRIEKAVGPRIPSDVRHEATIGLYTAVLGGWIAAKFIEKEAPRFRNAAWSMCGSDYGLRSLDAVNDEGWRLGDALADPGALDDIEAAAELAYDMDL